MPPPSPPPAQSYRVYTALSVISAALRTIGVLAPGQTPRPEWANDGLSRLNEIVDTWGTQRLTMLHLLRTLKTLAALQSSYTIGIGGAIDIVRPIQIERARLIADTSAATPVELPIDVLRPEQWEAIPQKTMTGSLLRGIYYDRDWNVGLGLIYPFPIPDTGTTQLVIYTPAAMTDFATLTTPYTFAPGYFRALRYALAEDLAENKGRPWTPDLEKKKTEALGLIKRVNITPATLRCDGAILSRGGGGGFNIWTGE